MSLTIRLEHISLTLAGHQCAQCGTCFLSLAAAVAHNEKVESCGGDCPDRHEIVLGLET